MAEQDTDHESAVKLMRAHKELSQVAEPSTIIRTLVNVCAPYGPSTIHLVYIHNDSAGAPETSEIVEIWEREPKPGSSAMIGRRFRIADFRTARAIIANPDTPQIVPDVSADAEAAAAFQSFHGTVAAYVGLPLYSRRHSTWQGIVVFHWSELHDPGPTERLIYELMRTTLAESIAAERTLHAYRDALAENERLLARAEAALQETQRQRTMLQLILDNLPIGVMVLSGRSGQCELINRAGREVLGFAPEGGAIDLSALRFHAPGSDQPIPSEQAVTACALRTGQTCREEVEASLPGGGRALLDLTASPLTYAGDPEVRVVALYQDITALRRTERERLAAQEELLQVQAVALAERSTPLIPIREDVLIMPLVGSIDAERGRQILDTLVHLGGRGHVQATIIDVTGVRSLDTAAAQVLLRAARALRLRGVRPILTGLQSGAAMTLVELGVDFSDIVVRGTMQDGVALATGR